MCYVQYITLYQWWPCAFTDEVVTSHGPIEADKENIRQEPYSLPQGFMWDTLDLSNAEVVRLYQDQAYMLINWIFIKYFSGFMFLVKGIVYTVK